MNLKFLAQKGKFSACHFFKTVKSTCADLMFWGKALHNLGAVTGRALPTQSSVVIITVR